MLVKVSLVLHASEGQRIFGQLNGGLSMIERSTRSYCRSRPTRLSGNDGGLLDGSLCASYGDGGCCSRSVCNPLLRRGRDV